MLSYSFLYILKRRIYYRGFKTRFSENIQASNPYAYCGVSEFLRTAIKEQPGTTASLLPLLLSLVTVIKLVLVITCLGGQFGINCPSGFLKI